MNKKDEINKNTIIAGIGFIGIAILIAIIAVFNIFTPSSRAQVEKDGAEKVAQYTFDEAYEKEPVKDVADNQWSKGYCKDKDGAFRDVFKNAKFVNFDQFDVKEQNYSWDDKFAAADKADFTFAAAKDKNLKLFDWDKPSAQNNKPNFDVKFAFDKSPQS